ncbi:MAG: hypothetical protein ACKVG6_06525 [Alphaproteobacteria bacterium]
MAIAATASSFDVALWFVERARIENNYLQAQNFSGCYDWRRASMRARIMGLS